MAVEIAFAVTVLLWFVVFKPFGWRGDKLFVSRFKVMRQGNRDRCEGHAFGFKAWLYLFGVLMLGGPGKDILLTFWRGTHDDLLAYNAAEDEREAP